MSPSQSTTSQCGWGCHTVRDSIDPGGPCLRSQVVGVNCKDMEGFLIRGEDPILSGCGGTSTLARGATLAARWLHEPQSAITQWGWSFYTLRGGIDPGDLRLPPRVVVVVDVWNDF